MPFAKDAGHIARCLQRFRDCHIRGRQPALVRNRQHPHQVFRATIRAPDGVDAVARAILTGEQHGAARRAVAGARVCLRKHHPVLRQPIDVRRFVEIGPLILDVLPPQIVRVNQHDIRTSGSRRRLRNRRDWQKNHAADHRKRKPGCVHDVLRRYDTIQIS
jgi:hypothetical protein